MTTKKRKNLSEVSQKARLEGKTETMGQVGIKGKRPKLPKEKIPYKSKGPEKRPIEKEPEEGEEQVVANTDFCFEEDPGQTLPLPMTEDKGSGGKSVLDELIEKKRKALGSVPRTEVQLDTMEDEGSLLSDDEEADQEPLEKEEEEEKASPSLDPSRLEISSFHELSLSRPIQRGIAGMGFVTPTPIQAVAIPVALAGKDICGGAVTGSGKTGAFIIPILERLLYRNRSVRSTRVLVLLPTRELALQCFQVTQRLSAFTDIQTCLLAGGLNYKSQENDLKKRPDILVATPGRLIDHLKNSTSFSLESIEILVLDEADRMLDVGFEDELKEIVMACPRQRQTMLFSATLTEGLQDLVRLSLSKPARLFVDSSQAMANKLTQEFIRIRSSHESDRSAIILALATHYYRQRTIVFFPSKLDTHRAKILFGLHGLKAAELHGNLNQSQRLEALEQFKSGEVDFLLATDLAARGLDIAGVETVMNYSLPLDYRQYLHRIGRTARAGKSGRSVSLVGEADRKTLKLAIKNSRDVVKQRVLRSDLVTSFKTSIEGLEGDLQDILEQEKQEKSLKLAEMELTKAQNMIQHADEIYSRPKKTFIQKKRQPIHR